MARADIDCDWWWRSKTREAFFCAVSLYVPVPALSVTGINFWFEKFFGPFVDQSKKIGACGYYERILVVVSCLGRTISGTLASVHMYP